MDKNDIAITDFIDMTKKINSIADLELDKHNANKGTDRGKNLLGESLVQLGAGRSILADKFGRIIAGNKTVSQAQELGLEIQVVQTSGEKLVCVQRTDLDLYKDDRARTLATSDNRVAELDLDWDVEQLLQDIDQVSIEGLWSDAELKRLQDSLDLQEFEAIASDTEADEETDNEPDDAEDSSKKADSDLVPFHCMLSQSQRKKLFDAINEAKSRYGLETTAEALNAIAEEYLND